MPSYKFTLRHGCSPVNLLHIFRTLFLKNTSGWLLLKDLYQTLEKFLKNFLRECQLNGIFVMILQMSLMKPALLYKNVNVT